jgi:hypothetical protein
VSLSRGKGIRCRDQAKQYERSNTAAHGPQLRREGEEKQVNKRLCLGSQMEHFSATLNTRFFRRAPFLNFSRSP